MIATALITLLLLMALAIPVAASMGVLALVLGQLFAFLPVSRAAGEVAWASGNGSDSTMSFSVLSCRPSMASVTIWASSHCLVLAPARTTSP